MTQTDIIEMARQVGLSNPLWIDSDYAIVEAFAKLVEAKASAKEREECAGLCDRFANRMMSAEECADAIRARGSSKHD